MGSEPYVMFYGELQWNKKKNNNNCPCLWDLAIYNEVLARNKMAAILDA